eukprot:3903798-Rhodomonas_salina.1
MSSVICGAIGLCVPYAILCAFALGIPLRFAVLSAEAFPILSATLLVYASPRRCPVLTERMVQSGERAAMELCAAAADYGCNGELRGGEQQAGTSGSWTTS